MRVLWEEILHACVRAQDAAGVCMCIENTAPPSSCVSCVPVYCQLDIGGKKIPQPFDGDGAVAMFAFKDGKVFFSNRFVRTRGEPGMEEGRLARLHGCFCLCFCCAAAWVLLLLNCMRASASLLHMHAPISNCERACTMVSHSPYFCHSLGFLSSLHSCPHASLPGFLEEQAAGKMIYRGAFSVGNPTGGMFWNPFDFRVKSVANTGVVHWAGEEAEEGLVMVCVWEGGGE
jgi:hypothetical protein